MKDELKFPEHEEINKDIYECPEEMLESQEDDDEE